MINFIDKKHPLPETISSKGCFQNIFPIEEKRNSKSVFKQQTDLESPPISHFDIKHYIVLHLSTASLNTLPFY